MYRIGLTGGIASGKSTVSKILRELGAAVIDFDQVAKEVQKPHTPAWQDIVDTFGRKILREDLNLDRQALGELVFNNPQALGKLNRIVHPRVNERAQEIINQLRAPGKAGVVIFDVPLLIEANMINQVDEVWVVSVSEELQIKRLMNRDKFTRDEALARLRSQMPLKDKLKYAQEVIDNSGTMEETRDKVFRLWQELQHRIALRG